MKCPPSRIKILLGLSLRVGYPLMIMRLIKALQCFCQTWPAYKRNVILISTDCPHPLPHTNTCFYAHIFIYPHRNVRTYICNYTEKLITWYVGSQILSVRLVGLTFRPFSTLEICSSIKNKKLQRIRFGLDMHLGCCVQLANLCIRFGTYY